MVKLACNDHCNKQTKSCYLFYKHYMICYIIINIPNVTAAFTNLVWCSQRSYKSTHVDHLKLWRADTPEQRPKQSTSVKNIQQNSPSECLSNVTILNQVGVLLLVLCEMEHKMHPILNQKKLANVCEWKWCISPF